MTRAGRDFEQFVAHLEQILARGPVELRSPDYITGNLSGSRREIDISLRATVGSTRILVIIECRDRSDTQDVSWIEQLATKSKDVGANKTIAVSSTEFSSGARNMADIQGIELRTFRDVVTSEQVFGWLGTDVLVVTTRKDKVDAVSISVASKVQETSAKPGSTDLVFAKNSLMLDTPILHTKDGNVMALNDIWQSYPKPGPLDGLAPGEKRKGTLVCQFPDPGERPAVQTTDGAFEVVEIRIKSTFSYDEEKIPIGRYFEYRSGADTLSEGAVVRVHHEGESVEVALHTVKNGDGTTSMTMTVKRNDPDATGPLFVSGEMLLEITDSTESENTS